MEHVIRDKWEVISTNPPSVAFGPLDGALIGVEMGGHLSLCPGGDSGHNFMVLLQGHHR